MVLLVVGIPVLVLLFVLAMERVEAALLRACGLPVADRVPGEEGAADQALGPGAEYAVGGVVRRPHATDWAVSAYGGHSRRRKVFDVVLAGERERRL